MYFKRVILREKSELPWPLKFRQEKEESVPKNGSILYSGGWRKNMRSRFLFQLFFFSLAFFSPGSSSSNANRVSNKNIAQYFAVLVFNFPARVLWALSALGLLLADGAPIVELGIGEDFFTKAGVTWKRKVENQSEGAKSIVSPRATNGQGQNTSFGAWKKCSFLCLNHALATTRQSCAKK